MNLVLVGTLLLVGGADDGQAPREIPPQRFGFDLPPGPLRPGAGRRVATKDQEGTPVVAKVHVQIGEGFVVMLPDGRLVARRASEARPTEKPFAPATKEQIASKLRPTLGKNFRAKPTTHYLFLYNTSEQYVEAASRIMESMFRGVMAYGVNQKVDVHQPEVPLVVIMFRSEAEFQHYRRMPPGVLAYYHVLDNRVAMYEESKIGRQNAELGRQQTLSTMAHEGAHQILHNIGVQQRLSVWPQWLGEGLAEYFAPTSTDHRLRWKGAGQVNDLRMFELEQYVKSRAADVFDGRLIKQTVGAGRLTSTGYAAAWALTHYLAKRDRRRFHEFVSQVSKLGPMQEFGERNAQGIVPENTAAFRRHFGEDLVKMEKSLVGHLRRLPYKDPFADRPHYVAMITYGDGNRVQRRADTFHSLLLAEKWRGEFLAKLSAEQRRQSRSALRRFAHRLLAERFAKSWLRGR